MAFKKRKIYMWLTEEEEIMIDWLIEADGHCWAKDTLKLSLKYWYDYRRSDKYKHDKKESA